MTEDTHQNAATNSAEPIIQIDQLSRSFGKKEALCNVSLSIPKGSVFGLVGENGAGKTTIIKHILGLLRAKQGDVRVFGLNPVAHPVEVLRRVGYLSEDRDMPAWMTISQFMRYNRAFYEDWNNKWDPDFAKQLCEQFELSPNQKIKQLSRGQLARTGLLVALAHRPELLVLDEPSSGLDPLVRRDILSAIIRTVSDEGRTVLFSSHLLDEVEQVADQIAMIHQGQIVLRGPLNEVLQDHRRLILRFQERQVEAPPIPGALSCVGSDQEWTVICNGGLEQLKSAAAQVGAEVIEEATPTLDEVFMARVRTGRTTNFGSGPPKEQSTGVEA